MAVVNLHRRWRSPPSISDCYALLESTENVPSTTIYLKVRNPSSKLYALLSDGIADMSNPAKSPMEASCCSERNQGKGSLLHYPLSFRWPIQMLARNSTSLRQNSFCEVLTLDNSPGRFFQQAKSASRKRLDYECWSVNGLETTEQAEMENVSDISSQREGGARSLDEETHLRWHYSVGVLLRTRILSWWTPMDHAFQCTWIWSSFSCVVHFLDNEGNPNTRNCSNARYKTVLCVSHLWDTKNQRFEDWDD